MQLDIPVSAICRLTDRLKALPPDVLFVVLDLLAEVGLVCRLRADGSFDIMTSLDFAKRAVVQELMKCKGVTKHETH